MTQADEIRFGDQLKDGFKSVNSWVSHNISWIDDIQQFYRERSVIEREYASKLNGLVKRGMEKKAKKSTILSVGDSPTMTPGSLESASLATWQTQLATLDQLAAEHDQFGKSLLINLADPLKTLQGRYEELRRAHADYAAKLERERDAAYSDLRKCKARYDAVCQEVENRRKKGTEGKAQIAFQQQKAEMSNVKVSS